MPPFSDPAGRRPSSDSTASLLARAKAGDPHARDQLMGRFLPVLRHWGHSRLPQGVRGLIDTDDLVQISLVRALDRLGDFEPRYPGALLAYLRRIMVNQIRDQIRRAKARPGREELDEELSSGLPTPLDELVGRETLEAYDRALAALPEHYQQAFLLRVEFGMTYEQIAEAMDKTSPNAARLVVVRAITRLAREMKGG